MQDQSTLVRQVSAGRTADAVLPENVGCEVGVCSGSEAARHHLDHGHHCTGQADLRPQRGQSLGRAVYRKNSLLQAAFGMRDHRLVAQRSLTAVPREGWRAAGGVLSGTFRRVGGPPGVWRHLGEAQLGGDFPDLLLVVGEDVGMLQNHRQAGNALVSDRLRCTSRARDVIAHSTTRASRAALVKQPACDSLFWPQSAPSIYSSAS